MRMRILIKMHQPSNMVNLIGNLLAVLYAKTRIHIPMSVVERTFGFILFSLSHYCCKNLKIRKYSSHKNMTQKKKGLKKKPLKKYVVATSVCLQVWFRSVNLHSFHQKYGLLYIMIIVIIIIFIVVIVMIIFIL